MTDPIDISAWRAKRDATKPKPPHGPWMFSIDVFSPSDAEGEVSGRIHDFEPNDGLGVGDRMRRFAGALEAVARMMRAQAQQLEPDKDGHVMAVTIIWESSRVQSWTSDKIETPEQREWLARRFHDAIGIAKGEAKP